MSHDFERLPMVSSSERPSGLVVLTFHRVLGRLCADHDIRWQDFESILDQIAEARLSITTNLAADPARTAGVILTFDDGTSDHARVATMLTERNLQAVFFVNPGHLGQEGYLSADQVRCINDSGHVIGSHGLDHAGLDALSPQSLRDELATSRSLLAAVIGEPVQYFAPPGGKCRSILQSELELQGYGASRTTKWGIYRDVRKRYEIPSVAVTSVTIERGWIEAVIAKATLPLEMRVVYFAKELLPKQLRDLGRSAIHTARRRSVQ